MAGYLCGKTISMYVDYGSHGSVYTGTYTELRVIADWIIRTAAWIPRIQIHDDGKLLWECGGEWRSEDWWAYGRAICDPIGEIYKPGGEPYGRDEPITTRSTGWQRADPKS